MHFHQQHSVTFRRAFSFLQRLFNLFMSVSGGSSSSTLRYVWKPLLSLAECENTGNANNLDSTMMCAGEAGKDACQVNAPRFIPIFIGLHTS